MARPFKFKVPGIKPARLRKLGKAVSMVMKGLADASLAFVPILKPTPKSRRASPVRAKPKTASPKTARARLPGSPTTVTTRTAVAKRVPKKTPKAFAQHRFTNAYGSRDYKLYIPAIDHGRALPLVVMLHGCSQTPDDFAAGTRMNFLADKLGFLVAYPGQSHSANSSRCWNWFSGKDQSRDAGEPSLIAGITRQVLQNHKVDPRKVYIAGLSAGGAAAAIMAETYPDLFAAVGIHSGVACGAAHDMLSGYTAMTKGATPIPRAKRSAIGMPLIVFHGDHDRTVHPSNAEVIIARRGIENGVRVLQDTGTAAGAHFTKTVYLNRSGKSVMENWRVHQGGHAWFGGSDTGSYATSKGPNASEEMIRFFLLHAKPAKALKAD